MMSRRSFSPLAASARSTGKDPSAPGFGPTNSSSIWGLGDAGAGAPWDKFGDELEHLTVAGLNGLGPRWLLAETREDVEAGKGRETSATAAEAELVAAMPLESGLYFFGGGRGHVGETTAVTAAWCMMLLALHPEWQARVRDEVRQACAAAAAPDFTSLHKMKTLTMVIQETLRLYPAGSVVSRQALRGVTLGGVRVPAGVNIYVPVSTVHLDPALWGADAPEFNPERFAAQPPPHAYLPFGAGARTCLGQAFAMAELKVLLALVLSRFELSLSPAYVHSPALRLIVEPEHGVRLVLKSLEPSRS